jgi:hypothetical protein
MRFELSCSLYIRRGIVLVVPHWFRPSSPFHFTSYSTHPTLFLTMYSTTSSRATGNMNAYHVLMLLVLLNTPAFLIMGSLSFSLLWTRWWGMHSFYLRSNKSIVPFGKDWLVLTSCGRILLCSSFAGRERKRGSSTRSRYSPSLLDGPLQSTGC